MRGSSSIILSVSSLQKLLYSIQKWNKHNIQFNVQYMRLEVSIKDQYVVVRALVFKGKQLIIKHTSEICCPSRNVFLLLQGQQVLGLMPQVLAGIIKNTVVIGKINIFSR